MLEDFRFSLSRISRDFKRASSFRISVSGTLITKILEVERSTQQMLAVF
ncbi:DNA mismatch repair protein MutS [Rickettsia prowazekii str. NMRC Madrid E]|nr:DNA mismatch repair protein MutS [Rickettsia prowazekii str. NMRC Madrid E]